MQPLLAQTHYFRMARVLGTGGAARAIIAALADAGHVPSAQIALVMHRHGLGLFGSALCEELQLQNAEVLAIDIDESKTRQIATLCNHVIVADATDEHGKRFVSNLPLLLIDDEAEAPRKEVVVQRVLAVEQHSRC